MPTTHREPLCLVHGVTVGQDGVDAPSQLALPDLHRSYRLMRQTKTLLTTSVLPSSASLCRLLREPLLGNGPSRRYLCDLCIGAWVRTPSRLSSALIRFFLLSIGLSLGSRRSTRETLPQTASRGGCISRLQPFTNVQAPILAWPSDCSNQGTQSSSRPQGRIHRAEPAPLPGTGTGIATCPKPDN